ncbi:MAG: phytoene desaturase family protein [Acidimicrobiales bacterium]
MSSESTNDVDVVIVGAGHNALVCAAYLSEAGLRVIVLEGRDIIGGNTITEELTLPGWQHDACSSAHVVIQSNPLLLNDELGLKETYGLEYLVTDPAVVFPIEAGDALIIHPDVEETAREFERFSTHDAVALREMMSEWEAGLKVSHAYFQAGLDLPDNEWSSRYEALRSQSAWHVVHEVFEHPTIRRAVAWMSFATIQPPERPGTGALVAAIMAGRLKFGWSTPVGGSGSLPGALRAHIEDHGGTVVTNAFVQRFILDDDRCVGVETSDGRSFRARRAVVTSSHLKSLPEALDRRSEMINRASAQWHPGLSVFAVHFALRDHVTYRSANGSITSVAAGLGTPEGLQRQVNAALEGRVDLKSPWLLLVDSTVVDPQRAPGVTFKFLTIAPTLRDDHAWTEEDGASYAQHLIRFARNYVDGLDDENILMMRVETPTTLAAHNIANIGGSCHGGEFVNDDGTVFPGWKEYRTDIPGLYLTGSTSHPGGSVSGRPGRNTARVLLEDLAIDATSFMRRP